MDCRKVGLRCSPAADARPSEQRRCQPSGTLRL